VRRVTRRLDAAEPEAMEEAVSMLRGGGLVAFATDTVYGVGACAFLPQAVADLYAAKERPRSMAIPLLLAAEDDLRLVVSQVPAPARHLMRVFWPGGLTLILPRHGSLPDVVTAGQDSVAVRLPDHAVPRELARRIGVPLAVTSANLSGRSSPVAASDVQADLDGRIDLILDSGPCPGGVDSTIVDLTGTEPRFLRVGAISRQAILAALAAFRG
jgi:L-threonylcarbamoyladenylate synthase